ncbi:DNA primase, partial [Stenotrophomonas geniculata]|nr:DNA primase [Stenotrophomonas geniculata]
MSENYGDVLQQLQSAGLLVTELDTTGRMVRCRVEGSRERRGWYALHELNTSAGEVLVVGTYGVWHGNENGATKVDLRKRDKTFSDEQREALRNRLAEDRRRAETARQTQAKRAAERASSAWAKANAVGEADYLVSKGVQGFGLRYGTTGAALVPLLDVNGQVHGLQVLRSAKLAAAGRKPAKEYWP